MIENKNNFANSITSLFGFPDPMVVDIVKQWNALSDVYGTAGANNRADRDFFLGNQWDAEDLAKKERVHRVYNYGAQLLRKFQMYEGAKGFDLNVKYQDDDQLSLLMAEAAESVSYQIIDSANFFLKFLESRLAKSLYGTIYYAPIWQPENKNGGPRGTVEIRVFTPERCRVVYQSNDYEKPEAFITAKRMNIDAARRIYGKLVKRTIMPDEDIHSPEYHVAVKDYVSGGSINSLINPDIKNMVTVWNRITTEKYQLGVGDQTVIDRPHKYKINGEGFCPVVPEHNIYLIGSQLGLSDLYFVRSQLKALNKLYSLLEEIVDDNAYPIMFEINGALRGTKLKRGEMRGKVIPMNVQPGEEGIRQLQASTLVQPVLAAIAEVKSTIFDISSMPAAAFGAYQPNTKSGFQATIQMQPALQEIDGRHVRTASAIEMVLRMSLAILETEDPESLTIELPEEKDPIDGQIIAPSQKIKLENLSAHQIEILFGNPLPKDDARVIQNETAKQANKFQSKRTTMQNLGVENPSKEMKLIEDEDVKLAEINAKVQSIMLQAQMEMQAKAQQATQGANPGGTGTDMGANGPVKPGQNPAQKFPAPTEEREPAADTADIAVADTSVL